jgi:trimeric autotransporter adhesin
MKNVRIAILAVCLGTLGSVAALAQTDNTAYGTDALGKVTTGSYNSAFGYGTLYSDTAGSYNTATGYDALYINTTGGNNIGIGASAGIDNPVGSSYNIDIGSEGSSSDSDTIRIGTPGTQTSFYAAGVDGVTVSSGVEVFINSSGQLGTVNSSIRFKEDVHDMGDASSAILRLRPVTYRYKQPYADGSKPIDYGLIAEEVAKVYPDLVVKGADGQIQTVQYQKLTPMLLNELQKQHLLLEQTEKTVEQQQQTMEQQQETIQLLKIQQTATVQLLEKRLAALEAAQSSGKLEARVATQ